MLCIEIQQSGQITWSHINQKDYASVTIRDVCDTAKTYLDNGKAAGLLLGWFQRIVCRSRKLNEIRFKQIYCNLKTSLLNDETGFLLFGYLDCGYLDCGYLGLT